MRYGSVCSGIEAATVAWHPLGWEPVWFSEIEPFPCRLLAHYYPNVPNLGDMLKLHEKEVYQQSVIDLLVGGTPCQSFSTAGLRAGLASANGNLALEFCRILATKRPRWFVWENVPGVFSSGKGEDFRSILRGFSECGYGCAWRVLDAQFFGVPQRRRRVFVVGYLGDDWRPSASVLFEPQGLRRNPPKGRKAGKEIAGTLRSRPGGRGIGPEEAASGQLIAGTIDASYGRLQGASGQDGRHGHSTLITVSALTHKVYADNESTEDKLIIVRESHEAIGFQSSQSGVRLADTYATLDANNGPRRQNGIIDGPIVRRLTPLECERLQGFPDDYTAIPGAADSPRYEAIGNSMAVPVMAWIGRRIDHVDKQLNPSK